MTGGRGLKSGQAFLSHVDIAHLGAAADGFDGAPLLGDLVGNGGLTADAQHGIPAGLCGAGDALPRLLNEAEVGNHLVSPAAHCVGVGLLCHRAGFEGLALILKRLDLGVDGGGEVVVLFVEFFGGIDRLAAQLGKALDGVGDFQANGLVQLDGSGRDKLDIAGGDLAAVRRCGNGLIGGALGCTGASSDGAGHVLQLAHGRAGGIARHDDGAGQGVGLFAALVVGHAKRARSSSGKSEGVDEADDVATQRPGGIACAAEHVSELAALLQEDGEGLLATGN